MLRPSHRIPMRQQLQLFLLISLVSVSWALCAMEYPLGRACEIEGMSDEHAHRRIQDAYQALHHHAPAAEAIWNAIPLQEGNEKRLGQHYTSIMSPVIHLMGHSFGHYAWTLQPNRFQSLASTIHYSISSNDELCAMQIRKLPPTYNASEVQTRVSPEETGEHIKKQVCLAFQFPRVLPQHCVLMPAPSHLFLGRLISSVGHELGHVLYSYKRAQPVSLAWHIIRPGRSSALALTIGCLPTFAYRHAPQWMQSHPYTFLGIYIGSIILGSTLGAIALNRALAHEEEHYADYAGLLLAPRSIRYGALVDFTELQCSYYYYDHHHFWPRFKEFFKSFCVVNSDTHPSHTVRFQRIAGAIVQAEPATSRLATVQQLERIVEETLENYPRIFRQSPASHMAVHNTRHDLLRIFTALRTRYDLPPSDH